MIFKDAFIEIDGTDLSEHFRSVNVEDSAAEVEDTGFGADYNSYDRGLKDASITGTVKSNFEAASVDSVLAPLYESGETFTVEVRPTSAAVGATNPSYTMTSRLFSYAPVQGDVGSLLTTDVTFRCGDQNGIVRATS